MGCGWACRCGVQQVKMIKNKQQKKCPIGATIDTLGLLLAIVASPITFFIDLLFPRHSNLLASARSSGRLFGPPKW
jgi:hypothetical protein